jgi:hypothetical protein
VPRGATLCSGRPLAGLAAHCSVRGPGSLATNLPSDIGGPPARLLHDPRSWLDGRLAGPFPIVLAAPASTIPARCSPRSTGTHPGHRHVTGLYGPAPIGATAHAKRSGVAPPRANGRGCPGCGRAGGKAIARGAFRQMAPPPFTQRSRPATRWSSVAPAASRHRSARRRDVSISDSRLRSSCVRGAADLRIREPGWARVCHDRAGGRVERSAVPARRVPMLATRGNCARPDPRLCAFTTQGHGDWPMIVNGEESASGRSAPGPAPRPGDATLPSSRHARQPPVALA